MPYLRWWHNFGIACGMLVLWSVVLGLAYPLLLLGLGKIAFPEKAAGSLIRIENQARGAWPIGQGFTKTAYFWGRPSAATITPEGILLSGGSNLALSNPKWQHTIRERITMPKENDPEKQATIPLDLLMASASGLDPDISLAAAHYQVPRLAKARNLPRAALHALITQQAIPPVSGIFGQARVNVLALNLALDCRQPGQITDIFCEKFS